MNSMVLLFSLRCYSENNPTGTRKHYNVGVKMSDTER